jgi:lysophospholipid acyltransferase
LPSKKYYDIVTYIVTQLTFSFATIPFLVLSLSGSLWAWAQVYNYALVWTLATLAFFASPGKALLKKQLEKRTGKASTRLVRTVSTESITGKEPILGISKDPEGDLNEAIEEFRGEVEFHQAKKDI